MATFYLECALVILRIATGASCLRVAARHGGTPFDRLAWRLTGAGFLLHGVDFAVQKVFGGAAIVAGNGSPTMTAYLAWMPVMNHSRTFLLDGVLAGLILIALYPREPDRALQRALAGLTAVGFAAGVWLGMREGAFAIVRHYSAVALWDVVELVLLLVALFVMLMRNRADRVLWALLASYGAGVALSIFWFAGLSQWGIAGAWFPWPWTLPAMRLFFAALTLAAALWGMARTGRGMALPRMIERRPALSLATMR